VAGLGDACRALGVPVVGGNVSLYNEGSEGPIYPTPVVGMVGRLPDPARVPGMGFAREGDAIALVGPFAPEIDASEVAKLRGRLGHGLPELDLEAHAESLRVVREAAGSGLLSSAHDVSEGGLACAIAECCIAGGIGARIEYQRADAEVMLMDPPSQRLLWGEGPGGVVVSGPPQAIADLGTRAGEVGFALLGQVGGKSLEMKVSVATLAVPVEELRTAWERAIPDLLS
jgi:phosphoribosylformylglycinamidine synthase subunit PurL